MLVARQPTGSDEGSRRLQLFFLKQASEAHRGRKTEQQTEVWLHKTMMCNGSLSQQLERRRLELNLLENDVLAKGQK